MTGQAQSDKREKSIAENIVIVSLVASLMGAFIYYFFKQEEQIAKVGFESVAATFLARVNSIRAQWFVDDQPNEIVVGSNTELTIKINKHGWVDFANEAQKCHKVWFAVMNKPLTFMKRPVAAISIDDELQPSQDACRYQLPDGRFFDYFPNNGKVVNHEL